MVVYSPDPPPGTGNKPVTYVSYTYDTPAENRVTHERIPGYWFRCHITAAGRRHCVLFTR